MKRIFLPMTLMLAACGQQPVAKNDSEATDAKSGSGEVALTNEQISTAGIEIIGPTIGGSGGAIELPATIDGDPDATRVVAAPIEGRIITLTRNLGDYVRRGDTLAVLESREGANLQAEVEKARSHHTSFRAASRFRSTPYRLTARAPGGWNGEAAGSAAAGAALSDLRSGRSWRGTCHRVEPRISSFSFRHRNRWSRRHSRPAGDTGSFSSVV